MSTMNTHKICLYEPPNDCAPSKDRSAWASAQSDQSLRCPHETDQTGQMPRLI